MNSLKGDMEFFGVRSTDLVVICSLFIGALIILVGFIIGRRTGSARTKHVSEDRKNHETVDNSNDPVTATTGNNQTIVTGSGKRAKNKKRREAQQEFTHSWMVGALKGHTGPVLDMNFSSDGKFLASCAEDCGLMPEEDPEEAVSTASPTESTEPQISPSPSASTSSSSSMEQAAPKERDRTILSRRQRKNRTRATREQRRDREDDAEDDSTSTPPPPRRHHRHQQARYLSISPTRSTDSGTSSNSPKNIRKQPQITPKTRKSSDNTAKCDYNVNQITKLSNSSSGKKTRNLTAKRSHQRSQLNHLSDADLASLLRRYALSGMELVHLGYPVECSYYPGYAVILNHHPMGRFSNNNQQQQSVHLDVNAREFVPSTNPNSYITESEADSGNGSGSSVENSDLEPESLSDSDKSSDITETSSSSSSSSDYAENARRDSRSTDSWGPPDDSLLQAIERPCVRCRKSFFINRTNGQYITHERCTYHWGKLRNASVGYEWECCSGREQTRGCTTAKSHVWTGLGHGFNGPFTGYVRTRPSRVIKHDGNYGVYALDCEMCFTRFGLELAKVTVVGIDGEIVYDTLVKPNGEIIDYNTRFSGITAKQIANATKTLKDVQKDLTGFVNAETILIGHGLENDLRALKILHTTVVDTCVAFPHYLGYPYRCSLKTLAKRLLKREIQVNKHDSFEDAKSAVDLMLRRVELDLGRT